MAQIRRWVQLSRYYCGPGTEFFPIDPGLYEVKDHLDRAAHIMPADLAVHLLEIELAVLTEHDESEDKQRVPDADAKHNETEEVEQLDPAVVPDVTLSTEDEPFSTETGDVIDTGMTLEQYGEKIEKRIEIERHGLGGVHPVDTFRDDITEEERNALSRDIAARQHRGRKK